MTARRFLLLLVACAVAACEKTPEPIAPMAGFKEAWNGPLMQDIRRELLKGRFHPYCFDSPDCPIVRKAVQAQELSPGQRARLWAQRAWDRWARRGYGWPGHVYRRTKHRTLNALGHVRRLFAPKPPSGGR